MMAKALLDLFQDVQDQGCLSDERLESLAALDNHAELESDNLAKALSFLASVMAEKSNEAIAAHGSAKQLSDHHAAAILYQLSNAADNISAMVRVSSEAVFLQNKRAMLAADSKKTGGYL